MSCGIRTLCITSPIGPLTLTEEDGFLTRIRFEASQGSDETPLLLQVRHQLKEYFGGTRKVFTVPLKPEGSPFRMECWGALCRIPYGETRTYGQQAAEVGRPRAAQAVGGANHHNPIPIIIPCHRVIGTDGNLTGYAGGTNIKQFLLELEGANCP